MCRAPTLVITPWWSVTASVPLPAWSHTLTVNLPTNNVSTNTFYRWDADPNSAGIQDGVGTWTNVNWSAIGDGSDDTSWVQASDAVFGGGRERHGWRDHRQTASGWVTSPSTSPLPATTPSPASTLTLTNGSDHHGQQWRRCLA